MRIAQVIARVDDPAAGPSYAVPRLCAALADIGQQPRLHAVEDPRVPVEARHPLQPWGPLRAPPGHPRALVASSALRRQLRAAVLAGEVDIVHNHGLWLLPNLYAGLASRVSAGARPPPLVVSPRGALAAWALQRSRWRKRVSWLLWQRRMLQSAACFHATSEGEADDIRRLGFRQPICVVPNGIDLPHADAAPAEDAHGKRTLLYLGRLHPAKGIDRLLQAWQREMHRHPDWHLRIAGPDNDGHEAALRTLAASLGLVRVQFSGPAYGDERLRAYRDCALFVLPSHGENFGLTVAEALAAGRPAIAATGTPWAGLATHGAGWWVDNGVEPLADALHVAMATPDDARARMGAAGRAWVEHEFAWMAVARRMAAVYRWLLQGGDAPAHVRCD
jgi:glycosyltransferase involved in cell wall biosynthesis